MVVPRVEKTVASMADPWASKKAVRRAGRLAAQLADSMAGQ
jgi:hypothetical protein